MIIKIKSHKRAVFGKILNYMIHNKDRLYDKDKKSFAITHNLKGNIIQQWEKQYRENETHRLHNRINSVRLTHEILSWHKDDAKHITLAKMEDMARQYIQLRNPNGIFTAVPHFDKDHYHVHICASGVEYKTGKSLRLSRAELQQLKVEIQNYQKEKFPELSKSVVEYGKKNKFLLTDKEFQIKRRTGRETKREQLSTVLKTCFKKADSRERFFKLLEECGLKTYERGGKITGVIDKDLKFRFSRLGYTEERFEYLDKATTRNTELGGLKSREVAKIKNKPEIKKGREQNKTREDELQEIRGREPAESLGREREIESNDSQESSEQGTENTEFNQRRIPFIRDINPL